VEIKNINFSYQIASKWGKISAAIPKTPGSGVLVSAGKRGNTYAMTISSYEVSFSGIWVALVTGMGNALREL
jgi:uncharacterized RmlC-like cupin family protein